MIELVAQCENSRLFPEEEVVFSVDRGYTDSADWLVWCLLIWEATQRGDRRNSKMRSVAVEAAIGLAFPQAGCWVRSPSPQPFVCPPG